MGWASLAGPCAKSGILSLPGSKPPETSGQTGRSMPQNGVFSSGLTFAPFCRHNVWAELALRGLLKDLVCPHRCSGQLQVNQELSSATTGHKLPASPVLTSHCHYLWGHTSSCACSLDSHGSASSLHTFLQKKLVFPDDASLPLSPCCSLT